MGNTGRTSYTTQDEIDFINELSDRVNHKGELITRFDKLLLCKKNFESRYNWDNIDEIKISKHLNKEIEKEGKKQNITIPKKIPSHNIKKEKVNNHLSKENDTEAEEFSSYAAQKEKLIKYYKESIEINNQHIFKKRR